MQQKLMSWNDYAVNELSNTIDLPSTLVRAQYLFRRFQRTVEAIDRKQSFPAPSVRQRRPASEIPSNDPANSKKSAANAKHDGKKKAASTGNDAALSNVSGGEEQRVISPELRSLLSRKVEKLDKRTVVEHGGGVGQ
ncbi:MAG: hypothetical protein Q9218_008404 [Villophora microphyllina]